MKKAQVLQIYTAVIASTPYSVATPDKVAQYADTIISHIDKTYPEVEGDGQEGYINRALDFANKYLDNMISQQEEWKTRHGVNQWEFGLNSIIGSDNYDLAEIPEMKPRTAADKDREKAQAESRAEAARHTAPVGKAQEMKWKTVQDKAPVKGKK